jgi:hypothetical protein
MSPMTERLKVIELPWPLRAYVFIGITPVFAYWVGFPLALISPKLGIAVIIAGFGLNLTKNQTYALFWSDDSDDGVPRLHRLHGWPVTAAYAGVLAVLIVGAVAAVLDSTLGAYLLIAGLIARLGLDLWVAVRRYNEVMRRPWPSVAPLADEDDW